MSDRELLRRLSRPTKVSILAVEARAGTLSSSDLNGILDILSAGPAEKTGLARSVIESLTQEGVPKWRLTDLRAAFGLTDTVRLPGINAPASAPAQAQPSPTTAPASTRPRSSVLDTRTTKLAFRAQFEDSVAVSQARAATPPGGTAAGASRDALRTTGAFKRVLIADDDQWARATFRSELQSAGYYVFEARDGRDAWQRLQTPGIDVLVMDMKLSGMSGVDLLSQLKASSRALPVVVCTTLQAMQSEFAVATYPRLCFLTKPLPTGVLAESLRALLTA
jgi:CheY-like chemotaxis protein